MPIVSKNESNALSKAKLPTANGPVEQSSAAEEASNNRSENSQDSSGEPLSQSGKFATSLPSHFAKHEGPNALSLEHIDERVLVTGSKWDIGNVIAILDYIQAKRGQIQPDDFVVDLTSLGKALDLKRSYSGAWETLPYAFYDIDKQDVDSETPRSLPKIIISTGRTRYYGEPGAQTIVHKETVSELSEHYRIPVLRLDSTKLEELAKQAQALHFQLVCEEINGQDVLEVAPAILKKLAVLATTVKEGQLVSSYKEARTTALNNSPSKIDVEDFTLRTINIIRGLYRQRQAERDSRSDNSIGSAVFSTKFISRGAAGFARDVSVAMSRVGFDPLDFNQRYCEDFSDFGYSTNMYVRAADGSITTFGKLLSEALVVYHELIKMGYKHSDLV